MDCQLVPVCISYGYTTIPDGAPLDSLWILDAFRIDSLSIFQVFAMHSLWIPHGFPYGSPMDSIRIPYGFPMDFLSIYDGVPVDLQFLSRGFPRFPVDPLLDFRWITHYGFPKVFLMISFKFNLNFRIIANGFQFRS